MDQDNQSSRGIPRELAQNLVAAVREEQIANEIVDDHVALFLGINRTDGRCLDIVERHGRMTAGALATESGLTTGAVTAVIDRLESAGYLQRVRDASDRRKVFIELTPLMTAITKKLFYNMEDMFQGTMSRLTVRPDTSSRSARSLPGQSRRPCSSESSSRSRLEVSLIAIPSSSRLRTDPDLNRR